MTSYKYVNLLILDDEIDLLNSMYNFLKKKGFGKVLVAKKYKRGKI